MTAIDSVLYILGLCITLKGVAMLVDERSYNSIHDVNLNEVDDSIKASNSYDSVATRDMEKTVDTLEESELVGRLA